MKEKKAFVPPYDARVTLLTNRVAGMISLHGLETTKIDKILMRRPIIAACDALGLTLDQVVRRAQRVFDQGHQEREEYVARVAKKLEEETLE